MSLMHNAVRHLLWLFNTLPPFYQILLLLLFMQIKTLDWKDMSRNNYVIVISISPDSFVETRKSNGLMYPPSTLHQLLCGILRRMRELNLNYPNFLDKSDNRFWSLQSTLDSYFHKLHSEGIGRKVKHAEVITTDEGDQLWESGVLNVGDCRM